MGAVKSQFLHLCYSKRPISKDNLRPSASPSAYVLQADLLTGALRNDEIPVNSGDGKQRHAGLRPERWEGCAYPRSHLSAVVLAEDIVVPICLVCSPTETAAPSPLLA